MGNFTDGSLAGPQRELRPALTQGLDFGHDTILTDDTYPLGVKKRNPSQKQAHTHTHSWRASQDEELITKKASLELRDH